MTKFKRRSERRKRKGERKERGRRVLAGMSEEEEKGGTEGEREACAGWDE